MGPGLGGGIFSDSRVTLWRGEGLSLLLAPAHRVDVGAAGVTPETENTSLSQGPLRTRTTRPHFAAWRQLHRWLVKKSENCSINYKL